jgi:hypothetical protein
MVSVSCHCCSAHREVGGLSEIPCRTRGQLCSLAQVFFFWSNRPLETMTYSSTLDFCFAMSFWQMSHFSMSLNACLHRRIGSLPSSTDIRELLSFMGVCVIHPSQEFYGTQVWSLSRWSCASMFLAVLFTFPSSSDGVHFLHVLDVIVPVSWCCFVLGDALADFGPGSDQASHIIRELLVGGIGKHSVYYKVPCGLLVVWARAAPRATVRQYQTQNCHFR